VVCLEREIGEFVKRGGSGEEVVGVKLKDLEQQCEGCSGSMVVSFGEVEIFVGEDVDVDAVRFVVSGLTRLLKIGGEKVSLLGVAETSHTTLHSACTTVAPSNFFFYTQLGLGWRKPR